VKKLLGRKLPRFIGSYRHNPLTLKKSYPLMLFREIVGAYYENQMKHINKNIAK